MLGRLLPWAALSACWLLAGGSGDTVATWHLLVFVAFLVVLGIPHGAVDHLVMAKMVARRAMSLAGLGLIAAYVVVGGAILAGWVVWPGWTLVGFIAVTVFHWGQGDLWFARRLGVAPTGTLSKALFLALRGGIPIVVPLLVHPASFIEVSLGVVQLFEPTAHFAVERISTWTHLGWLVLLTAVVVYALWTTPWLQADACPGRQSRWTSWLVDVGELALLVAFFSAVPPILAIGVYLCLWHSPRHLLRLAEFTDEPRSATWADLGHLARSSVPMSLGAVVLFVGVFGLLEVGVVDTFDLLAASLAFVAALTGPHVCVVVWMDLRQRIWG